VAQTGLIIVISAPSGAGKNTVIRKLREIEPNLTHTISATTRAPRKGEENGREYYFLPVEEFERRVAANAFAEWAEVHGNLYGTLLSELDRCQAAGADVILEVDVQGMRNLLALDYDLVSVFIMPPSMEELERRLRLRGTDSEEVIAVRLANAVNEVASRGKFDYIVVNDKVERAADDIAAILRAERRRSFRLEP
jgi:guanylate kinase